MRKPGRPKVSKNVPISPWLSAKKDCREGRFIQIGNSLLFSELFHRLKDSSKYLYLCMAMEAAGRSDFLFPLSVAKKYGISESTLRRGLEDLKKEGFIELTSSGQVTREPNYYRFVYDWKPP